MEYSHMSRHSRSREGEEIGAKNDVLCAAHLNLPTVRPSTKAKATRVIHAMV